jgi:hypothetical protein
MVGTQGLALVVSAIVFGVIAALLITRLLGSVLYEVRPTDRVTLFAVCSLFLPVGALACWIPARRAALVDPRSALRCE